MAGFNSILGFVPTDSIKDIQESIGITQFPTATGWHQTIGGLQIQGGITPVIPNNSSTAVPFHAPYETQLLGVWLQSIDDHTGIADIHSTGTDLTQFTMFHSGPAHAFYWIAIGV